MISPQKQMQFLYRRAAGPDDFPWHEDKPPRLLEEAIASKPKRGRALDVGCGSGFYTVYLARQGFDVIGVDFVPEAIGMARERAAAAGVDVQLVEADVLQWESDGQFDLVLDRGMLNLLRARDVSEYRRRLLGWLSPDGDYVLDHALKRRPRDWRPIGPTRRREADIVAMFEPDLELRGHERFAARVPLPVGPWLFFGVYWFHRPL
jgi:SAM-dependent methyltransferase